VEYVPPQHFYAGVPLFLSQSAFEYVNDVISDEIEVKMHLQTFKKFNQNAYAVGSKSLLGNLFIYHSPFDSFFNSYTRNHFNIPILIEIK